MSEPHSTLHSVSHILFLFETITFVSKRCKKIKSVYKSKCENYKKLKFSKIKIILYL